MVTSLAQENPYEAEMEALKSQFKALNTQFYQVRESRRRPLQLRLSCTLTTPLHAMRVGSCGECGMAFCNWSQGSGAASGLGWMWCLTSTHVVQRPNLPSRHTHHTHVAVATRLIMTQERKQWLAEKTEMERALSSAASSTGGASTTGSLNSGIGGMSVNRRGIERAPALDRAGERMQREGACTQHLVKCVTSGGAPVLTTRSCIF
jgi:hypothetical protein